METKLRLISEIARKDKKCRFNNLAHLLNVDSLRACFYMLKKGRAAGVDEVDLDEYEVNLERNLQDLVGRMKRQAYKPKPVRRVYIPKANGKMRPLGIPSVEDKVVQMGITRILTAIWEEDFLDCSYGFRPERSCHDALTRLDTVIMAYPVNHVIDADIKGFFDNVNHGWMEKFLRQRIADENLIRLILRFLKGGVMEEGRFEETEKGTPQGGILSPVLANIYLHYIIDRWIETEVKSKAKGYVEIVRYADDFVICAKYRRETEAVLASLKKRLQYYGLELAEDKTRIIEFGRFAQKELSFEGRKPETFKFLGFTHFCGKSKKGRFYVGRRTDRKKLTAKLKEMNQWLKTVRCMNAKEWWPLLILKMKGHYQYYGIVGNDQGIYQFYYQTRRMIYKWMNRRSQKKSFIWDTLDAYLKKHKYPRPKAVKNIWSSKQSK